MKKFTSFLVAMLLIIGTIPTGFAVPAPVMHEIYVATDGSDSNDGTISSPFKTFERAKEEVEKLNKNMTGDINVIFRQGTYRPSDVIEFTSKDSGTNGYYVNYKSYPGETAKISGGIKITGWEKQKNNLWAVKVDNIEYAQQLYVNGKRARRASSEDYIDIIDLFKDTSTDCADGVVVPDSKYASYENVSDIQLHFARGWRGYTINVVKASASGDNTKFWLLQPTFKAAQGLISTPSHSVASVHNFILENAFEELDVPGEFYYNRKTKMLYYYPRSDEDMKTADVELAVKNFLFKFNGEIDDKVKNITFDSMDFAHFTWHRLSKYGHIGDQAQDMLPDDEAPFIEPGYSMVPAAIQLFQAEKINFTNSRIYDIDCVGIGLYLGVVNCKFEGNAFFDLGDSAMSVGTADFAYNSKDTDGVNVAGGKEAKASSWETYASPNNACDGNGDTIWNPPSAGPHWWSVDLGKPYTIDRIEIDDRLDTPSTASQRSNMEVIASNDPDFKNYKVIASLGPQAYPALGTGIMKVKSNEKFRYVRINKNDYFLITEVRVISKDIDNKYKGVELCRNNAITNNVITRIGIHNYGAPGIQAYYTEGTAITHNHIYEVPYSGFCSGWGWTNYPDNFDCRDHRLNYNLLENHMQICFDGGGIYLLGNQPNTTLIGNHSRDQHNNLSAIYLDSGSERITLKNNVTGIAPFSFTVAGVGLNNLWQDNWSRGVHDVLNYDFNNMIDNNAIYIPGNAPLDAVKVMMNAGLERKYMGLEEKAGENMWPVPRNHLTNNAVKEIEFGLMNDQNFASQYLNYYIHAAQEWLKLAEVGDGLCQYTQEACDELQKAIDKATAATAVDGFSRQDILDARWEFFDACDKFCESKNSFPLDELIKIAQTELDNAVIGSKEGMSHINDYNTVKDAIREAKEFPDGEFTKQYLEQSILSFRANKVNLDIHDVEVPDQNGSVVIDKENQTVTVPIKQIVDVKKLIPDIKVNEQVVVTPDPTLAQDFTNGVEYTLSTADGVSSKKWMVYAQKPIPFNSNEPFSLKDAIADKNNWNMFTNMNCSNYFGQIYGDVDMVFDMEIASREASYPCFIMRGQDPDKDFTQVGNDCYVIVFTPGFVEVYRFNDGVRTQFYGNVPGCKTIFGDMIASDAFKFGQGVKNKMEVTCRNEGNGVRLKMVINGETIYDFVDNYEGKIMEPGYIGTVSPASPVILTAE